MELKEIWKCEFMKLLKIFESDLKVIRNKNDIKTRLYTIYKGRKANVLYNFYLSIMLDGLREVKKSTTKSTYYRNVQELKSAKIDFSQKYTVLENKIIQFNPFEFEEVI